MSTLHLRKRRHSRLVKGGIELIEDTLAQHASTTNATYMSKLDRLVPFGSAQSTPSSPIFQQSSFSTLTTSLLFASFIDFLALALASSANISPSGVLESRIVRGTPWASWGRGQAAPEDSWSECAATGASRSSLLPLLATIHTPDAFQSDNGVRFTLTGEEGKGGKERNAQAGMIC